MFSRRLLRIKVLQTLYSYHNVAGKTYSGTEKELIHSIEKSFELYHLLMVLLIDVVDYAELRIEQAKQKNIITDEDLHPNTRFIDNQVIRQLRQNAMFTKYLVNKPISWVQYPEIVRKLSATLKKYKETGRSHWNV